MCAQHSSDDVTQASNQGSKAGTTIISSVQVRKVRPGKIKLLAPNQRPEVGAAGLGSWTVGLQCLCSEAICYLHYQVSGALRSACTIGLA